MKKVENGITTYFLRSTLLGGQVVAELNSAGAFARGFVYLGGQLLAVQQNNQVNWVHQDPLVKSKRVTNSAGTVVSTVELDPWGGDTNRSSNEAFQPRRFTTYDRDGNLSDDAMHRRYNRWHSRFDQPDPYGGSYDLTDPQSFNRYSYVQNDPVNFVDPTGLCPDGTVERPDALGEMQCVGVGAQSVDINISGGGQRSAGVGGTSSGAIEIETSGNGPTEAEIIPRNSSTGDPFRLSLCLQWLLAPYFRGVGEFRGLDLNGIKIYEGLPEKTTRFAVIDVAAITLANSIYFAPGQYSANLDGIELVAHELTHVKQWLLKGQIGFASAYLSEYRKNRKAGMSEIDAYANISFEKEAAE